MPRRRWWGWAVIVVCRSLRKDGDGDSAVLMNCPARISCEPNTVSASENSLSSLKDALKPSITREVVVPVGGGRPGPQGVL